MEKIYTVKMENVEKIYCQNAAGTFIMFRLYWWGTEMPYGFETMLVLGVARLLKCRISRVYSVWRSLKLVARSFGRRSRGQSDKSPR